VEDQAGHWDDAYRSRGVEGASWYQREPAMSLDLVRLLGVEPSEPVIDIGGGASFLVDRLLELGFVDVSVLDVSEVALRECHRRLGHRPSVNLIRQNVLVWQAPRRFRLWHDRAVFHFLTDEQDRATYLATLSSTVSPGGSVIMATFAEDGPTSCSGLPVARYSAAQLAELLGEDFTAVAVQREIHATPMAGTQPFTWIAATKNSTERPL
jgi:hypothetical protein